MKNKNGELLDAYKKLIKEYSIWYSRFNLKATDDPNEKLNEPDWQKMVQYNKEINQLENHLGLSDEKLKIVWQQMGINFNIHDYSKKKKPNKFFTSTIGVMKEIINYLFTPVYLFFVSTPIASILIFIGASAGAYFLFQLTKHPITIWASILMGVGIYFIIGSFLGIILYSRTITNYRNW